MAFKNRVGLASLLLLVFATGCGSKAIKPTDEQNAFASVEGLGDMAGDDDTFASAFISGAVPDDRIEYGKRGYQVNGDATFDGDQATVPVRIFGGVHATSSRDTRNSRASTVAETEQTWTLQRVDGQWKLKDAPLG